MDTIFYWLSSHAGIGFALGLASAFFAMAAAGFFNRVRS